MTHMMIALFYLGCISPVATTLPPDPLSGADPVISSVSWTCDPKRSLWTLRIVTEAWTGGGLAWMARDADRYEEHRIRSVEAASDGSTDALELELDVVADWRDASPGSSTGWHCSDQPQLTFQVAVFEITGSEQTDCLRWGATPDLWDAFVDVNRCDNLWDPPDTGEDTP